VVKPYSDKDLAKGIIRRVFESAVSSDELVWHRDHNTREIKVVEGIGWKLQLDDSLPIELNKGDTFKIEADQYHRVLRGDTNLVLEINESNS
jgi:quercetin dioxygenase-like cupin family protein|tara:strand:- start:521 stop:796 length:276 start_codon:yes stop_codon:yes gene_type:complete